MILLCGIPSEPPLAMVRGALDQLSIPYIFLNQRDIDALDLTYAIEGTTLRGTLTIKDKTYPLDLFNGVYLRMMDDQYLPELETETPESARRQKSQMFHHLLWEWCEIMPGRVVNRLSAMGSNFSKPYQAQFIRNAGLGIPDTLITNCPDTLYAFSQRYPQLIYKSISGVRSIVKTLEAEDWKRIERIRWCPTQFQEYIEGNNVRVHVVGNDVFATRIISDVTDYRYAESQGGSAYLEAVELEDDIAEKCVRLADNLNLAFAGIDLKITPAGQVYCFEVNPCPAYSYYEAHTEQPIAAAVAHYLHHSEYLS